MASRTFKAVAAIGTAVCITAFGFAAWQHLRAPTINVDDYLNPPARYELMNEPSREWMEVHGLMLGGKDGATRVYYRNGNVGDRFFRTDGTLEAILVKRRDGSVLADLEYSPTGKMVVSGFEFRQDGTLRRRIRKLAADLVETVVYWQDGVTVFSRELRGIDAPTHEITFFRATGKKWSEQSGSTFGSPVIENLYDENGMLARFSNMPPTSEKEGAALYYRPDGTVRFTQQFLPYKYKEYEPGEGAYEVTSRALKVICEFNEKQSLVRRITMRDGGKQVQFIDIYNPATGELVDHIEVDPLKANQTGLPPELLDQKVEAARALDAWKEAEVKVSESTETK